MQLYKNKDIRKLDPCYDPIEYYSDKAEYTLLDILDNKKIPVDDKIWVVTKLISEKDARLFAVWCAREALKLIDNPDPRSVAAVNTAEKYAYGKATIEELNAARNTAWDATKAASMAAARTADNAAACAASYAAWNAASDAARAAACDSRAAAACAATRAAVWSATRAASWAADAAWDAARDAQLNKLKEICYEIIHQ